MFFQSNCLYGSDCIKLAAVSCVHTFIPVSCFSSGICAWLLTKLVQAVSVMLFNRELLLGIPAEKTKQILKKKKTANIFSFLVFISVFSFCEALQWVSMSLSRQVLLNFRGYLKYVFSTDRNRQLRAFGCELTISLCEILDLDRALL